MEDLDGIECTEYCDIYHYLDIQLLTVIEDLAFDLLILFMHIEDIKQSKG